MITNESMAPSEARSFAPLRIAYSAPAPPPEAPNLLTGDVHAGSAPEFRAWASEIMGRAFRERGPITVEVGAPCSLLLPVAAKIGAWLVLTALGVFIVLGAFVSIAR